MKYLLQNILSFYEIDQNISVVNQSPEAKRRFFKANIIHPTMILVALHMESMYHRVDLPCPPNWRRLTHEIILLIEILF